MYMYIYMTHSTGGYRSSLLRNPSDLVSTGLTLSNLSGLLEVKTGVVKMEPLTCIYMYVTRCM